MPTYYFGPTGKDGVRAFTNCVQLWARYQIMELDDLIAMLHKANPELAIRAEGEETEKCSASSV